VEVSKMREEGREIIMIGHDGHPEVEGTMGQSEAGMHLVETVEDVASLKVTSPDALAYVSQTTLSVDDTIEIIAALKARFPKIAEPKKGDICYATTNRQHAVKFMATQADVVIVVGSPSSSNSTRLREVAEKKGCVAYMVDNASEINPAWIKDSQRIGVTAGASAPEILVQEVVEKLKSLGVKNVRELEGVEEHVTFPLPKGLPPRTTSN
jgi:4-hydroxy-3-methylbut-2-enyl diphosphate reductase